jgi:hypothetical protein
MKGTDLAIVELDAPIADLLTAGIPAYRMATRPTPPGTPVVIVGGPSPTDGAGRRLRLAACTLGAPADLVERDWTWSAFPSDDCADIRPGSSGSPVFDPATGEVVALVNTTTAGSGPVSDCVISRPCEVRGTITRSREDTAYGPSLAVLAGCFDAGWTFTGPSAACALDPGLALDVDAAVLSANPSIPRPLGGPPTTTWGVELSNGTHPALTHHRVKSGRLGEVDCTDPAGYGEPIALADDPAFDEPLPTDEGRYQLCVLAGPGPVPDERWQEPRFASVVTTWVDRTPPIAPIELSVREGEEAWLVEPLYVPPELSLYRWKWGPPRETDCADDADYAVYRRFPTPLPFGEAPTRMCVIGHDDAGNPSAPLDRVFRR